VVCCFCVFYAFFEHRFGSTKIHAKSTQVFTQVFAHIFALLCKNGLHILDCTPAPPAYGAMGGGLRDLWGDPCGGGWGAHVLVYIMRGMRESHGYILIHI